ncbi:ESCRT-II complex subunit VPS36 [Angomonas deanei]|nr:ESCRT-II complex subunit VPS36 [Angomonas deanei]|eukprot:EPY32145.1 ESCRT-II complex subunit VPS36 [Angomonas deanei]
MEYFSLHNGPLVSDDEVLVLTEVNTALYNGNTKTQWKDGKISLSTHSLIFQALDKENTVLKLPLKCNDSAGETPTLVSGSLLSSDKIVVPLPGGKHIKISFRKGGASRFYDQLKSVLSKRAWRSVAAPAPAPAHPTAAASPQHNPTREVTPAATAGKTKEQLEEEERYKVDTYYTADRIGIAGVIQSSTESTKMTGTFKDIDDVMQQASSLVQNIKQLKQKSSGNSTQEANEFAQLESIEETLGLGVMVKARGGGKSKLGTMQSKYHVELANELHAWMTHPKNGKLFQTMPIIPLIELFSIYNKARSGDLVSPEDVLLACREMTGMPSSVYTLETLSSGRMALVHKDTSIVLHRLTKLLGPRLVNAKKSPQGDRQADPDGPHHLSVPYQQLAEVCQ